MAKRIQPGQSDETAQAGEPAENVGEDLAAGPANPLGLADDQAVDELVRHFATQDAPRVFALCEVAPGWRRATVRAWGLSFPDNAVLYLPGERALGCFTSAEHAHRTYAHLGDIRLVWPDYVPVREMIG